MLEMQRTEANTLKMSSTFLEVLRSEPFLNFKSQNVESLLEKRAFINFSYYGMGVLGLVYTIKDKSHSYSSFSISYMCSNLLRPWNVSTGMLVKRFFHKALQNNIRNIIFTTIVLIMLLWNAFY